MSPTTAKAFMALQALVGVTSAASTLLQGGTIIGWDAETSSLRVFRDGHLLVTDDAIAGIFEANEEPEAPADTERVNVTGKIITPGFIDTHTHRWQTAYRTIGSNTTLWEYVGRYGEFASEGLLSEEDVYVGQLMGLLEGVNAGVTTNLDHAHHTWSNETSWAGVRASIDSGARVFWSYAVRELANFTGAEQVQNFRQMAESDVFDGTTVELGMAFDGFSQDPELVEQVAKACLDTNVSVITTHAVGNAWGFDNLPSAVHEAGLLNTSIPVVFSHSSWLSKVEANLLRQTDQHASITPESEFHYGHLNPTSPFFMDQASLGVDTHFTFSADILTQARMWLQHVRQVLFRVPLDQQKLPRKNPMSVHQAFLLATRNGALALRRPDLGVLTAGAKADIVVWDGDSRGMLGWVDPVAAVMLHANVGDIEHVMVNGEFKKKDREMITKDDAEEVKARFLRSAEKMQKHFRETPVPTEEDVADFWGPEEFGEMPVADVSRGEADGYGSLFI